MLRDLPSRRTRQARHPKSPRQFGPSLPEVMPSGYTDLAQNSHNPLHLQHFGLEIQNYSCTARKQTQDLLKILTPDLGNMQSDICYYV